MKPDETKFLLQAWETLRQRALLLQREAHQYHFSQAANMIGADEANYSAMISFLTQISKPKTEFQANDER